MFDTKKLKTFSWVNVGNPDHEDFERLLNEYKIDEDTISDILDMDLPKHTFAFLRRDDTDEGRVTCVYASDYLKKNTDILKNAVDNDLFSASPDVEGIYALRKQ